MSLSLLEEIKNNHDTIKHRLMNARDYYIEMQKDIFRTMYRDNNITPQQNKEIKESLFDLYDEVRDNLDVLANAYIEAVEMIIKVATKTE